MADPKPFLSDEEMAALEQQSAPPEFVPDEGAAPQAQPALAGIAAATQAPTTPARELSDTSKAVSAGRGALAYGSFNFGDEIAAGIGAGLYGAAKTARGLLPGGVPADALSVGDVYSRLLEGERTAYDSAKASHPIAYHGAGIATSALQVPGVAGAGQVSNAARLAQLAASGGITSGLAAAGAQEGGIGERLGHGARGAVLGALLAPAADAAAQGAGAVLSRLAETQAAKSLGLLAGGFRKATLPGARAMGREALDAGVISPLASAETMLERAVSAGDDAGQALGGLRTLIDSIDPGDDVLPIAQRVEAALSDWQPGTSTEALFKPHMRRVVDDLLAYADPTTGKIGAKALAALKKDLADATYTDPLLAAAQLGGRLKPRTETARGLIQGAEEDIAGRVLSPDELADFLRAKTRYGAMSKAREALSQRVARDIGNNQVFGLSTQLGGVIGGTALGGPLGGLGAAAGAVGTRFLHQRGNQITATVADRLSKLAITTHSPRIARTAAQAIVAELEGR